MILGDEKPLASRPTGQFQTLRQSASNFVRRDAAGASGERQSMVQIHRPPANAVQTQQTQMQSLTMKEVMSDLQILHEQQQEGQRQLEQSRLVKQRRVEQYAVCEEKLRTLNYQHGQDRAYQKDLSEKLSSAALGSAKLKAAKSNKDIDIFERMLHQAIEAKRRLLSHHRGNRLHLVKLRETMTHLKSKIEHENVECNTLMTKYEEVQSQDKILRQTRDEKILTTQKIAGESVPVRAEHMKLQNEIDEQLQESSSMKAQMVSLKQRIEDTMARRKAAADYGEKLTASHKVTLLQMDHQFNAEQSQNKQLAETIKSLELEITTLKEVARLDPSGKCDGTPVDLARIQESIQAEQQSLGDEQNSSRNAEADIAAIRTQLSKIQTDTARTQKSVADKKAGLAEAKEIEERRQTEYKTRVDQLELKRNEVSDLEKAYEEEKRAKHERALELQKERDAIGKDIANGESNLAEIKECLQRTVAATAETEAQHEDEMHQSSADIDSWKEKLESEKKTNRSLGNEEASKRKKLTDLEAGLVNFDRDDRGQTMSSVEYKAAIAQLINEHPILQSIRVTDVSKDGHFESVAKKHLQPVLEHCEERIKSAQKMSRALKASAQRKEEEYQRSKQAAEAEEERQRRHREKRKKRLELEHSKYPQSTKKAREAERSELQNNNRGNGPRGAARPRELLSAFTQASIDSQDFKKATAKTWQVSLEEEPVRASNEIAKVTSSADRKVRWGNSTSTKTDKTSSHRVEEKKFGDRSRTSSSSRDAASKHSKPSNRDASSSTVSKHSKPSNRDAPSSKCSKADHQKSSSKDLHLKGSLKSLDRIPTSKVSATKGSPTISDWPIEGGKNSRANEKSSSKTKEPLDKPKNKTKSAETDRGKVSSHFSKPPSEKAPDRTLEPEKRVNAPPMYIDVVKTKTSASSKHQNSKTRAFSKHQSSKSSASSKHQSASSKPRSSVSQPTKGPSDDINRQESRPRSKERKSTDDQKESSKRRRVESQPSQTQGIPSTDRPSQSRRRVRTKTASTSKLTLQSFKNDVSFNFR